MSVDLAKDFRDLLRAFVDHEVRFLIVGAYALAAHGRPRATGDLDVWVETTATNAERAFAALEEFGAPLHDLTRDDLAKPGIVFQVGLPPLRIDILTQISGVDFAPAWAGRLEVDFEKTRLAHRVIPWSAIVGLRNRLIHGYDDVDLDILWTSDQRQLLLSERNS